MEITLPLVLYLESHPSRSVALAELEPWMGAVPGASEAWPRPDAACWLRVVSGVTGLVALLVFLFRVAN